MSQLDHGLCLSPQRLRRNEAREIKRLLPREHVIHGPPQLVREDRERFGLAVFMFQFAEIFFAGLTLTNDEYGGFGKRPA